MNRGSITAKEVGRIRERIADSRGITIGRTKDRTRSRTKGKTVGRIKDKIGGRTKIIVKGKSKAKEKHKDKTKEKENNKTIGMIKVRIRIRMDYREKINLQTKKEMITRAIKVETKKRNTDSNKIQIMDQKLTD